MMIHTVITWLPLEELPPPAGSSNGNQILFYGKQNNHEYALLRYEELYDEAEDTWRDAWLDLSQSEYDLKGLFIYFSHWALPEPPIIKGD